MVRRRHRPREISFGFDSFLDVVANVVGIIIRLILVVWVGARSYTAIQQHPEMTDPNTAQPASEVRPRTQEEPLPPPPPTSEPEPEDPLHKELIRQREELARAQAELLEQLRRLQGLEATNQQAEIALASIGAQRRKLEEMRQGLAGTQAEKGGRLRQEAVSLAELQQRRLRLEEAIRSLQQLPSPTRALRYRTPVSRPVQAEEVFFECRQGRVAYIDLEALLGEVKRGLEDKGQLLRNQWQVSDRAGPAGAFQMRYVVEREREGFGPTDVVGQPDTMTNFRYGLTEWVLEPIAPVRGESPEQALAADSQFRRVIDSLLPAQAAVTFWVYPDSFAIFRQLRDLLYDRDITVAGRPLPEGRPIAASSRHGSRSRGQ